MLRSHVPSSRRRRWAVAAAGSALLLAGCGAHADHPTTSPPPSSSTSTSTTPPTTAPAPRPTCPLTGQPAPGGKVPQRAALAIKVGNDPGAWPQSGLDRADIVIEEPIEGAMTRLVAIYQCNESAAVGPVRSTRWIDDQMLPQFGHPGFAFAGGIIPDEALVHAAGLVDLNFDRVPGAYVRISSRYPPENLYASTAALWKAMTPATAPHPIFHYGSPTKAGPPVTAATLQFSSSYSVGWQWVPSAHLWLRTVDGSVDRTAVGHPLHAANVVIERVATVSGTWPEDVNLALGVHSITVGSGPLVVLTGGRAVSGTWSRSSTAVPARLVTTGGTPITLAPGPTWVELLPSGGFVTGSLTLHDG
ncbi:MAG TPA: DUF3048 domain-containing protein [Acidimicrobiales bacterium]|nr:DUF3048 domain-containing protein [Acidimicrobiales bacterium]